MISATRLLKAIRQNCLDCSGGLREEVEHCSIKACALYPYRMGVQTEVKKKGLEKK